MKTGDGDGTFEYEKWVKGGQIYNYYLFVDGQMVVDQTQKKTNNGRANWIFVPLSEKNVQKAMEIFEKPLQFRIGKLAKLAQEIEELKRAIDTEQRGAELKKKSGIYNKLLVTINQDFLDRFVFDKSSHSVIAKVVDFQPRAQIIKIQKLFDSNSVLLNWRRSQKVDSISISEFLLCYQIMNQTDENRLRQEVYFSKKHNLFIKYFAREGECFPMEIRPQVNLGDYDINFDQQKNVISTIRNKMLGTEVMFHDLTLNELQGYVPGTVMEIWTQLVDGETLNIVHLHVNDTSDEVTLDVAYMHSDELITDFMEFKTDASGKALKYKIIVNDCQVLTVLYNDEAAAKQVQEIPFKEISVTAGSTKYTSKDAPAFLGEIESIPTGMIACANYKKLQEYTSIPLAYSMKNHCQARGFQDLLGFVDFQA